nr:hypothetical protein BaRGS_012240 [Batillaria attramentaria]
MDARGAKPLKDLLQSGGDNLFPTLSPGWTEAGLSFSELVERITAIDQQYTLLAPLLYLNARTSTVLSKYQDVYAQILTLLGANETVARDDAVDVVNFETEIAKFDWYGHLETLFAEANVSITEDEVVVNTALGYFDKLFDLVSSTPERTLLNYGMWRITWPLVGLTSKQLRDAKGSFIRLEEMAANLLEAFKEIVRESDWMSNTTKQAALEKADSMKYKIGYPDFIMNDTWLDERYKNVGVFRCLFQCRPRSHKE